MLPKGPAMKVCIYVNEDTRYHLTPLYETILSYLMHKGVAGATAFRGLAGFGAHQLLHTTQIELLTEHLPIRIEFVESPGKIEEILPTLYEMVTDGLIEVHDTTVVKVAIREKKTEAKMPREKKAGKAKLLRVYMGEADQWQGQPLYDAIVKRLRMMDIAGATVHRGILGYGAKGHTHKESFLHLSRDMPVMVAVIEGEEKIARAAEVIEEMVEDALIVVSDVEMTRLVRSRPLGATTDASLPGR